MKKRIIIVGATSGIGLATARLFLAEGWTVGIAGRREDVLSALKAEMGNNLHVRRIDVCDENASAELLTLISECGGADAVLVASGFGKQNYSLDMATEIKTMQTNAVGFTRMVDTAYHYFESVGGGHIAAISSIAGTKGLGAAPSYSSTKRMQSTYLQALTQLSRMNGAGVSFTDIQPGFVDTDFIKGSGMPLMMPPERVASSIVKAIKSKRRRVVVDWKYAILVFMWKLIPDFVWERISVKK